MEGALAFAGKEADDRTQSAAKTLVRSAVTKASACMFNAFASQEQKLWRESVRAEIRQLRSFKIKEAEVLPAVLWHECTKILAGKP